MKTATCKNPKTGKLVDKLIREVRLTDQELAEITAHTHKCGVCKRKLLDHAHKTVTLPTLEAAADRLGLSMEELSEQLVKYAEEHPDKFYRKQ